MNIKCFFAFWFNTYRYCPLNFISFTVIDYINENLDETIKLYRLFLELNIYQLHDLFKRYILFLNFMFFQFLPKNKWNVICICTKKEKKEKRKSRKKKIETEQCSCSMKTEFREVKGTGVVRPPRRQQPRRSATTRDPFSPNHGRLPSETPVRNTKRERHWSVGLRWIGEKRRREKKTEKKRKEGEGEKKKKGVEIIEIQASCFATSSRERTRTAATTTKFHRAAGTSCETRVLVWNGDRGRSQVQNPCASTSQGLGFGVTFAGIFVSTSDFMSFRWMYVLENRQGENHDQSHDFCGVRMIRYLFIICSANITNILANISHVGSYPHY